MAYIWKRRFDLNLCKSVFLAHTCKATDERKIEPFVPQRFRHYVYIGHQSAGVRYVGRDYLSGNLNKVLKYFKGFPVLSHLQLGFMFTRLKCLVLYT